MIYFRKKEFYGSFPGVSRMELGRYHMYGFHALPCFTSLCSTSLHPICLYSMLSTPLTFCTLPPVTLHSIPPVYTTIFHSTSDYSTVIHSLAPTIHLSWLLLAPVCFNPHHSTLYPTSFEVHPNMHCIPSCLALMLHFSPL